MVQEAQKEPDDIQLLVKEGTDKEVAEFLRLLHPADTADMVEALDEEGRARVFRILSPETGAEVLAEIEDHAFDDIVETIPEERMVEFVEEMDTDDAADFLGELPHHAARRILARISPEDSHELKTLMGYGEDTAGGLMQTELIAVTEESTVGEVIEEIRERRDEVEPLHDVFVVDDENKLKGFLALKELLLSRPGVKVSDIMDRDVVSCPVDMDQENVALLFMKYNLVSAPVVDAQGRLVGRIWFDDVMDAIEDEVDEDFLLMAGAGEEELAEMSVLGSVRSRLPWLIITWTGGIGISILMAHFRETMQGLIILAAFIPIVMGMGGNVGNQSATIMVRGLATGRIDYQRIGALFFSQVAVGFILGIIMGLATALFVEFRHSAKELSIIIGGAMVAVMSFSAFVGTSLPALFKRAGVDPAIATAPLISSLCDIMGILIYLSMASLLLG